MSVAALLEQQSYKAFYMESEYHFWQFEETGSHNGYWRPLSVEMNRPFHFNPDIQYSLPHFVSADSNGIARIFSSRFALFPINGGYGALRYRE